MNTEKLYWHLKENPPLLPGGERKRGGGHWDEYWRGYDGHRSLSAPTSFGRAAWRAGRDNRKSEERSKP